MQFDFRHILIVAVILVVGIYIGAKKPSLVSTLSGGALSS